MKNTIAKVGAVTAIAALATFGLSACTQGPDDSLPKEDTSSSQVLPPTIVDVAELNGTTVGIATGGFIDITTGDTDPADWVISAKDTMVVAVTQGGPDGSAVFNPGVEGLSTGSTQVELTNSKTGEVVSFTVNVK